MSSTQNVATRRKPTPLDKNQIRGFWAAWAGWALDGMDSFIYALVLVPAMRELLPRSGMEASTANIGYYGGLLFALFLVGWGLSMVWGPIGDRVGRIRALMLTILCYSIFTFTGALATSIWQLAIFRLLAGVGIGGEWTLGGTFVAEEWPEDRRKMGAGLLQTGFYFGFLLAAALNATVGATYGWRAMFAIGGLPAFLVVFIQYGVKEPKRWKPSESIVSAWARIFSPEYRRRTILNSLYLLISITGLWASTVYVPSGATFLAVKAGQTAAQAARTSSLATVIVAVGTILGCAALPLLAERFGRRKTLGMYFGMMFLTVSIGFGYTFYLEHDALFWFMLVLFFQGVAGGNFAMYSLWLPEQYRSECRASAFGFATSAGRFVGAGITFLVGAGVSSMGTIGIPVAMTSIAFLIGLAMLPLGVETKGHRLPE